MTKKQARNKVGWLVRSGQWPRPTAYKCECGQCDGRMAEEYHHKDYDNPYDVLAVNRDCHMQIHGGKFA